MPPIRQLNVTVPSGAPKGAPWGAVDLTQPSQQPAFAVADYLQRDHDRPRSSFGP